MRSKRILPDHEILHKQTKKKITQEENFGFFPFGVSDLYNNNIVVPKKKEKKNMIVLM